MKTNRKTIKMPVRYLMNAVLVALLFVGLSFLTQNVLSTYQNKVLLTVGINIILAVSLNVATGYLGQLPLGHAGFMAVGAYTCALFTKYSNLPKGVAFVIGLVLAWIMAGLFGVLIGIPALRTVSIAFLAAGFCIVLSGAFQALGKGTYSMFVSIARQLVVLVPVAWLLSRTGNLNAVWWSFPIAEVMSFTLSVIFLRRTVKSANAVMTSSVQ